MGTHRFVARSQQLAELAQALEHMLAGHGGVRFVVGDAGSGKTALVSEFARVASVQSADTIVAVGQSDAETGIGDPYLPFRELLAQLTGDVEATLAHGRITEENADRLRRFLAHSAEAIVDLGPDLVGTFIPGAGLATRVAAFLAKKSGRLEKLAALSERGGNEDPRSGGIEQQHILEQYTNVITRLSERQPLVLVLDDLQWADMASTGLLFRLGRNVADSRVLIVGTYRPAEVAMGRNGQRHPLEKVVAEFKRYFGDITVDLGEATGAENRALMDALLDSEPNGLSEEFRRALFAHTGGHPLFTIELLRALQERGDLVRDEAGGWIEHEIVHWDALPPRVEGVIEERIGRLDDDLHDTLAVASVEGEEFTAEVIATVRSAEPRHVVRSLGRDLEDQHRLVKSRGVRRLRSDGQRLSRFAFHHNLFQRYLYNELNASERAYLHEDVGGAIEALYGSGDETVVALARHFAEAGDSEKAVAYVRRAGEVAFARYANDEAVAYLTKALELTRPDDLEGQWDVLAARERVYRLQAHREAQEGDLEALRALADRLGEDWRRAEAAVRTAALADATGDYAGALAAAEAAVKIAARDRDVAREASARVEAGYALLDQGRLDAAEARFRHALGLAEGAALHRLECKSVEAIARIHSERGDQRSAAAGFQEALRISERLGDAGGIASALNNLGVACALAGELDRATAYFEDAVARARRVGDPWREGNALNNLGEVAAERHDLPAARRAFLRAMQPRYVTGDKAGVSSTLASLGVAAARLGLLDEAEGQLEECLDISLQIERRPITASGLTGLATVAISRGDCERGRRLAARALDVAEEIGSRRLASRALMVLGAALLALGRVREAAAAYARAVAFHRELGLTNAVIESVAGLAGAMLSAGDLEGALAHIGEILTHLGTGNLDTTEDPVAVYVTCHRVLAAAGDPRARSVLIEGCDFMMRLAGRIQDLEVRRSFLEDVPSNREITRLVTEAGAAPKI